jgi:transposase
MRRGGDPQQAAIFSYLAPEARRPQGHPLRAIRGLVEAVPKALAPKFDRWYAQTGRPSIAPEPWLRAVLLQVLDTVRRARWLREQLDYHRLFRWVAGLTMDDPIWDASTCSQHRERWLAGEVARACFAHVLAQARQRALLSEDHCTVDGPLLDAWAGRKSFKRKGAQSPSPPPDDPGHPSIDFRGQRRTNAPQASMPEARRYKKATGREAKLGYLGHGLMENRHGFVVDTRGTQAPGTAARGWPWRWRRPCPGHSG